jgi:hypothetical protein
VFIVRRDGPDGALLETPKERDLEPFLGLGEDPLDE